LQILLNCFHSETIIQTRGDIWEVQRFKENIWGLAATNLQKAL